MTGGRLLRVTVTCEVCGHRTVLAPLAYTEPEMISVVCCGCEAILAVVVTLPIETIPEPAWYAHVCQR
ncbi:MAG TPA: hypothetical protein VMU20_06915 [Candidatus Dormibacteraeota bacterium]|nr:hypothetical protein [Candidatus Dormibacteraeota bacterium]